MRLAWLTFPLAALVHLGAAGPLDPPPELPPFAHQVMLHPQSVRTKLEALLRAVFAPPEQGGLGMAYDNSRTRTVSEAWTEHRANCLTLTAFYVAACRAEGLEAHFAEVLNISHWQRSGDTIRFERHVVALIRNPPLEDLIADFMPEARRRSGAYIVAPLTRERVLALFHSNRAVEHMEGGQMEEALAEARRSLEVDPRSSIGWNIQGVVYSRLQMAAEAERSFRRALELEPNDGPTLGNLEKLMREQGNLKEAERLLNRSRAVRMKDPYFQSRLAEEALAEDRAEDALKFAKASVKMQPHDPDLLIVLARVRLAMGDPDGALKDLAKAKKLASPEEQARFQNKMDRIRAWKVGE